MKRLLKTLSRGKKLRLNSPDKFYRGRLSLRSIGVLAGIFLVVASLLVFSLLSLGGYAFATIAGLVDPSLFGEVGRVAQEQAQAFDLAACLELAKNTLTEMRFLNVPAEALIAEAQQSCLGADGPQLPVDQVETI